MANVVDVNNAPDGGFQDGGWYWDPSINEARQYNKDTGFGAGTTINNPNQTGYNQRVSAEVQAQSGYVAPQDRPNANNNSYASLMQNAQSLNNSSLGTGTGQPSINVQDIYNNAYQTEEITKAKADLKKIEDDIQAKRESADIAIANVNDNPWYSEARRKGEIAKIEQSLNDDLQTAELAFNNASGTLKRLNAEAETTVNLALKQYDINRQEYQDQLSRFNFLLESGALASASDGDIATLSTSLGISPSMIQGILDNQSKNNIKPQVITSTDDNGNVTFSVIDQMTGNIINQNSLGSVGKSSSSTGSTSTTGNLIDQFYDTASNLSSVDQNGVYVGVFPQLVAQFAPFMSLQDIYKNYLNTDLGKQYGRPEEDSDFIKQVYDLGRGQVPEQDPLGF